VNPKMVMKLQLIPSRDTVYKLLCKKASLKEYSPGEARRKGRLATKAELEAAMNSRKRSWSSFIFGFFTSHKVPSCPRPVLQRLGTSGVCSLVRCLKLPHRRGTSLSYPTHPSSSGPGAWAAAGPGTPGDNGG
jgi:hypothetical protein